MSDDQVVLSPDLAEFLHKLRQAARELKLLVEDRSELAAMSFCGQTTSSTMVSVSDLPPECHALKIDRFNVVLGVLPDIPAIATVRETLRRYRNQCVIARSYLTPNETLDLQLMLLGPRASERQEAWRALALMVERDDRVARKLAWLRPEDPQRDHESFADFLKRTFLARPWVRKEDEFQDVALDQLSSSFDATPGLPRTIAMEWQLIALDDVKTPDQIVAALVQAWERRGQV